MSTNRFVTISNGLRRLVTAVSASAGVADALKIIATGSDGRIDSSLMPVGIGAATSSMVASESLAAGAFVNIYENAGVRTARRADASNGRLAHGFVLSAVASAGTATVYQQGENTALSGLTPGVPMFLSAAAAGTATATSPAAAGTVSQELGTAFSATSLLFEYNPPVFID